MHVACTVFWYKHKILVCVYTCAFYIYVCVCVVCGIVSIYGGDCYMYFRVRLIYVAL